MTIVFRLPHSDGYENNGDGIATSSQPAYGVAGEEAFPSDEWFLPIDNTSNRCFYESCLDCEDQSVLMVALRWTKILILKVARMYHAAPICLMALPLLMGLVMGYWLGGRRSCTENKKSDSSSSSSPPSSLSPWLRLGRRWFSTLSSCFWHIVIHYPQTAFRLSFETSFGEKELTMKEDLARQTLRCDAHTDRESGVDLSTVPRHVAVIMDGNRRFGKANYGNATKGHWEGARTLVEFAKWCIAEQIQILTVYAFSTENWNRDPAEVAALMALFCQYCDELRLEAMKRNIRIHVLSSDTSKIPEAVKRGIRKMVDDTRHCKGGLEMNICLSYGSRGEIVNACRSLAVEVLRGDRRVEDISESTFQEKLLTSGVPDPDVIIRTSGEFRLSNFFLFQMAYSELFFCRKAWPELTKEDLLDVIRSYARGRKRRFGK